MNTELCSCPGGKISGDFFPTFCTLLSGLSFHSSYMHHFYKTKATFKKPPYNLSHVHFFFFENIQLHLYSYGKCQDSSNFKSAKPGTKWSHHKDEGHLKFVIIFTNRSSKPAFQEQWNETKINSSGGQDARISRHWVWSCCTGSTSTAGDEDKCTDQTFK